MVAVLLRIPEGVDVRFGVKGDMAATFAHVRLSPSSCHGWHKATAVRFKFGIERG